MTKEKLEQKFPVTFENKVAENWTNGVRHWNIKNATPGLYTLDVEHISDELVNSHNDEKSIESIASKYRDDVCCHDCAFCFSEQSMVYQKYKKQMNGMYEKNSEGNRILNKMLTLEDTLNLVDQAKQIAEEEGHEFRSVKFLGPGELLMNPQLFEIIEAYKEKNVHLNIFTKGALLGDDNLAQQYQGMNAKELVDKLASYENVGLLMSFQSFDEELQNWLVTTEKDNETTGLKNYTNIRNKALENIFDSKLYDGGMTDRVCMINAPIVPENIDESFEIYKFFVERGTPIVMTPSMISGKGSIQYDKQDRVISRDEWNNKLVDLYAKIYAYNVSKGVQTKEQIKKEGIASYVGAEPCNQASTGLFIRANGIVQMCPGRFDKETVFDNTQNTDLKKIWYDSPNKKRGLEDSHNLVNNKCPAKDGRAFSNDFYEKVMKKYNFILNKNL